MQPKQPQQVPFAQFAQIPGQPAPPMMPYSDRVPPKRGMPGWGIAVIIAGAGVVTVGIASVLIFFLLAGATGGANQGMCAQNLANINLCNKVFANTPSAPIGDKWCEGLALNRGTNQFTDPPVDAIEKSRLAFWRLIADPAIRRLNVSPGGPTVFHCPAARRGRKTTAPLGSLASPEADFDDPINQLYYSMFLQKTDGANIPTYGTNPSFIVMGDRSPASDDLMCNAGQNSANHTVGAQQTGQNVLYSAGNVRWTDRTSVGIDDDEIYLVGTTDGAPTGSSVPTAPTAATTDDDDTVLMPVVAGM